MKLWRESSPFERLVLFGTVTGAAFCWAIWPPLPLGFVTVVVFAMAAVIDRRTVAPARSRRGAPK
jgi:hypothetical protein